MARAYGTFVVKNAWPDPDITLGVFTVKHECANWLGKQADPKRYLVYRFVDGNLRYQGTDWEQPSVKIELSEFVRMPEFKRGWDTTHDEPYKD